jgi:Tol biopolymer transport system component
VDPTITNVNKINPNGTGNTIFAAMPLQYTAVSPNPNVQNQLLFAFTADVSPGASSVFAIYRNTTVSVVGAVKLTDQTQFGFNTVGSIGFLPNGQKIFFTAEIGSDHGLYLMNPNGTSVTRVASADDASLSPDGTKILFSEPQGGQDDLFYYTVADGTTHAVLQTANEDEIMPQWSKDGTKVVYAGQLTATPTGPFDIFVVTVGSASPVQLTANGDINLSPSLSPDGSQVAYARISTNVGASGVYKAPTGGGSESLILLDSTIGAGLYWTSSSGRAIGGFGSPSFSMGHTLHRLPAGIVR